MSTMKAVQVPAPGAAFELVNREIPDPRENEVLLQIDACGICHGDAVAKEGHFPGVVYPRVPGHEVVGVIRKTGASAAGWKVGQRVGVGWRAGHCFQCSACRRGEFWACENALTTGLSTDGGYAEYMTARAEVLVAIPEVLSSVEAAPLLCGGSTSFGALRNSGAQGGDLVAIQGFGGLGHLALQYAVRLGFRTVVLTRSREKQELARKLGAHACIDTSSADPVKELRKMGGARVILCLAPDSRAIGELVGGLGRGGQVIIVTYASEPMQLPPALLMRGGQSIRGWVGGNMADTLSFSVLFKVVPMVEVFPLEQAAQAFEKMMSAKVHFRSVLKMHE
ncbi:MAG: alcohol dehydrogenase catalytic domain-containing protein [Spirochaetia bacterium]|jgi:D-arabinose 1-dehydrogenase-like Zn-dependent alcohol dehydrogenase